jgi:hypothetical protein
VNVHVPLVENTLIALGLSKVYGFLIVTVEFPGIELLYAI